MRRALLAFAAFLGVLAYALGIRRKVVLANLALAFPEKPEAERRTIARATYVQFARVAVEFLLLPRLSPEAARGLFEFDSWDNFEAAKARGKGVIACTAHFGNFEVLAAANTIAGTPITMVSRAMGRSRFNDLWRSTRAKAGVEDLVVGRGNVILGAIRALEKGRVLGYVIDQNEPSHRAVFPTFFGVPAATSPTPAVLARRTGAAVVFTVAIPRPGGRHRVVIEGPIDLPDGGDRAQDELAFMQTLNDRLEHHVRAHPECWYWFHRRWKRRGDAPPPPAAAGHAAPPVTAAPPSASDASSTSSAAAPIDPGQAAG